MKHDINKNKYGYLGQYKSPLIYHWLLQQWVDGKATKKYNLPKLDGRLLLLDGHMFFYQKDWDILIELTRKAVREKEHQFFTSVFKNTEDKINEVLYLSEKLNKTNKLNTALLKKLFSTVHDMEFPWIVMIPMGHDG